jgi:hypothetical protein
LTPVARASAVTISRAAELLSKDQQTIAFALPEMEYLRELIAEHKHNIPAVLSGRRWRELRRYRRYNSMGARHRDDAEGV